jgi:hypothetical protein
MSTALEVLLSSAARVQVLCLFLLNPDRQYYQREIERETGQPIRAVQREVKRLAEIDLLSKSTKGNRVFYRLNASFPLLGELTALFHKATGVELADKAMTSSHPIAPEPSSMRQPFEWMETMAVPPLPPALRHMQIKGEWDRAY